MSEWLQVLHECEAVQIPYGNRLALRQGTHFVIEQQLGDTVTIRTEQGYLLRVSPENCQALGIDAPVKTASSSKATGPLNEEQVWEVLKTCYDPEIPTNIVELGLIYHCKLLTSEAQKHRIEVQMTLTAPGCGMGQVLKEDIERKLLALPEVQEVQVELTFTPPWEPSMMSESARLQLGMM